MMEALHRLLIKDTKDWADKRLLRCKARSGSTELLSFNHGFSSLLSSGLSVVESLDALKASAGHGYFRDALDGIAAGIRAGEPLSCAMKRHPDVFPALYIAAIAAGEGTG
ncbi:MAG: type II secretion system F family protein, partial [Deltaproteobacteria bacterium]|nr:type II secretion system F family protein [Deltaproteobacteria bacterium]